jgi:hypothetical protein
MISSCLLVATAILATATAASDTAVGQQNQLDMARVTQPTQRKEFPLAGEESAFKFNFLDQVCEHSVACRHACMHASRCSSQWGEETSFDGSLESSTRTINSYELHEVQT